MIKNKLGRSGTKPLTDVLPLRERLGLAEPCCPHGYALHDIEEYGDESPMCCVEGCDCGKAEK